MPFDWVRLLNAHGVPFVTRGPNTARGHVSVRCPFCGDADPSQHMGISLKGKGWGCLRNNRHRGRSRAKLIQGLLRCSSDTARHLAGEDTPSAPPSDDDFLARLKAMVEPKPPAVHTLTFPREFHPLIVSPNSRPFWDYLMGRGWTLFGVEWLARKYNLHYARTGAYRYRIIIPVYDEVGALMTWTARTIADHDLRYKTLERDRAVIDAKQLLFDLPTLWSCVNPEVLVVTEGPFDAMRITALGWNRGVYGTCLFGLNVSEEQVLLLETLTGRFRRLVLLLDPDARFAVFRIGDRMNGLGARAGTLPEGVEDPGTLTPRKAETLIQSWLT